MSRIAGHYNVSIYPRSLRVSWEPHERVFRPRIIRDNTHNVCGLYDDNSPIGKTPFGKKQGVTDDNKSYGLVSLKSKKKISDTIDWLCAISVPKKFYSKKHERHINFRLNFITLTLSADQVHTDNEIKAVLLNNFLTQLRNKWGCKRYFWRAESQKNNRIHFHLATDKYIPWWELRHTWNKIQNNLGYIDRFEAQHGHRDPNSTDIHSTKNIHKISRYIGKVCSQHTSVVGGEVSKNSRGKLYTPLKMEDGKLKPCYNPAEQLNLFKTSENMYRVIEGNLWGRSTTLSRIRATVRIVSGVIQNELEEIERFFKSQVFSGDFYHCISVPVKSWANIVKGNLYDLYCAHIMHLRYHDPAQIPIPI